MFICFECVEKLNDSLNKHYKDHIYGIVSLNLSSIVINGHLK